MANSEEGLEEKLIEEKLDQLRNIAATQLNIEEGPKLLEDLRNLEADPEKIKEALEAAQRDHEKLFKQPSDFLKTMIKQLGFEIKEAEEEE